MIADIYSRLPINALFAYDDSDEIYLATLLNYLFDSMPRFTGGDVLSMTKA